MRDADVFVLMHIAHRMLHSDAALPATSLKAVVKNRLLREYAASPAKLRIMIAGHPSLKPTMGGKEMASIVDAPSYRAGMFDLQVLVEYCDVNAVIVPPGWILPSPRAMLRLVRPRSSRHRGAEKQSFDLVGPASGPTTPGLGNQSRGVVRLPARDASKQHVVLQERSDGGYDAILDVVNSSRLLFDREHLEILIKHSSRRASFVWRAAVAAQPDVSIGDAVKAPGNGGKPKRQPSAGGQRRLKVVPPARP